MLPSGPTARLSGWQFGASIVKSMNAPSEEIRPILGSGANGTGKGASMNQ